jgi:hypothetical protein
VLQRKKNVVFFVPLDEFQNKHGVWIVRAKLVLGSAHDKSTITQMVTEKNAHRMHGILTTRTRFPSPTEEQKEQQKKEHHG